MEGGNQANIYGELQIGSRRCPAAGRYEMSEQRVAVNEGGTAELPSLLGMGAFFIFL